MAKWPPSNQACFNSAKHKIIHVRKNNTGLVSPGWKSLSCVATGPRRRYDRTLAKWHLRSQIYSAFERKIHKVWLLHVGITLVREEKGFLTWWSEEKQAPGVESHLSMVLAKRKKLAQLRMKNITQEVLDDLEAQHKSRGWNSVVPKAGIKTAV